MADATTSVSSQRILLHILIFCHLVPFALCACEHGTYDHQGIKCCHCGPGQEIKEHCTVEGTSGICVYCQNGKYKSEPSKSPCKECTPCHQHPDANMEEDQPCKHIADRKCRCKSGYFCPSPKKDCTICIPCTECDHGVKVACTEHNDTVCNSEPEGGTKTGAIVGAVFAVLVILAGIAVTVWWIKCRRNGNKENGMNEEEQPMKRLPIPDDIDPLRLVPELAKTIGWKDMRVVAMSSGISKVEIENCELPQPGYANESTIALLNVYTETHGKGWGTKLRDGLIQNKMKMKAQQVERILLQENNVPV